MLENDLSPAVDNTVYLRDYQPPAFVINKVALDFVLGAEHTEVTATLSVVRNGEHQDALRLDGEKMQLLSVALDQRRLGEEDYEVNDSELVIAQVPDQFELQVITRLQPHLNTELSGLYQSSGNFCTQCEAEGFRRITYFPDRPDVLSEYEVTITADQNSCPVLLSNGNPVAQGHNDDGTHWQRWHDPHPKPSYLFALVAGDLQFVSDTFVTASGKHVDLNIYTQAHNIDKCDHAMRSLKAAMQWDQEVYGREYDLDIFNIVAVDDFNMGAMENKGLNIFNSKYVLADQDTATDDDFEGIESVVGHEYFHNWSGNRVTCRDWFQLSLKEGFTVFRDQEFSADMGSRAVKRIRDVQMLRTYQFKEDAGPMAHPVRPDSYQEINNFYTVTIYEKGAEVIRMMHALVGAEGFRKATDLYFDRFDGQAVTTEDFVQCMEQANHIDLGQFRRWYTQAGTPQVSVVQQHDAGSGVFTLEFSQSCPATPGQTDKQPFYIPLSFALLDQQGKVHNAQTLVLDQAKQTVEFKGWSQPPVVSMLRGFCAPVKLAFDQSDADLAHLVEYDDDGFARWEAMQRLSLNLILPAIEGGSIDEGLYENIITALRGLIASAPPDRAILAEMLTLPSASYIADQGRPIKARAAYQVRRQLQARMAQDLQGEMQQLFDANQGAAAFSLSSEAMAQRALKNRALSYLVARETDAGYQLAETQYEQATNMTDRLAAFAALMHSDYPAKAELVDRFYARYQNQALVLDKWFALQATVPDEATLQNVQALLKHAAFSINNPNKVRSLIGAYTANMPSFHNVDGSGYAFLADKIIELNAINPQIAARLAGAFNSWRDHAEPNSSLMKQQLQRINDAAALSKDIKEIVSKALA
ncbi:MAG: aminopeptidase N [Gammaproteobacteria bacterium]|nr:aminopeptidase N [Gammaproteobacteria bacterium]